MSQLEININKGSNICQATQRNGKECSKPATNEGYCGIHYNALLRKRDQINARENKSNMPFDPDKCKGLTKEGKQCGHRHSIDGYCKKHHKLYQYEEIISESNQSSEESSQNREENKNNIFLNLDKCKALTLKGLQCDKPHVINGYCTTHHRMYQNKEIIFDYQG